MRNYYGYNIFSNDHVNQVGMSIYKRGVSGNGMKSSRNEDIIYTKALAAILFRGGKTRLAKRMANIAFLNERYASDLLTTKDRLAEITKKRHKRFSNPFCQIVEYENSGNFISASDEVLDRLCRHTDPSLYDKIHDDPIGKTLNVDSLSAEDCRLLTENFIRAMKRKSLVSRAQAENTRHR